MRTIEEMQCELRALAQELDQLKQSKTSLDLSAGFKKISASGYRYPITPHPLAEFDEHSRKSYITLLLTVAQMEQESLSDSLLLVHRIAFGMEYLKQGETLQEEFLSAQMLNFAQLDEFTLLFKDKDERMVLILEALLIAGNFEKQRKSAYEYIAQMSGLLNVGKEDLIFLSNMAAVILTNDPNQYNCKIWNKYGHLFDCYLKNVDFPMKIIYANIPPDSDFKPIADDPFSLFTRKIFLRGGLYGYMNDIKVKINNGTLILTFVNVEKYKKCEQKMNISEPYVVFDYIPYHSYSRSVNKIPIGVKFHYLSCDAGKILKFASENGINFGDAEKVLSPNENYQEYFNQCMKDIRDEKKS